MYIILKYRIFRYFLKYKIYINIDIDILYKYRNTTTF